MAFFSKFISYFAVLYRKAVDKIILIAEPALAYILLNKIMFIDSL